MAGAAVANCHSPEALDGCGCCVAAAAAAAVVVVGGDACWRPPLWAPAKRTDALSSSSRPPHAHAAAPRVGGTRMARVVSKGGGSISRVELRAQVLAQQLLSFKAAPPLLIVMCLLSPSRSPSSFQLDFAFFQLANLLSSSPSSSFSFFFSLFSFFVFFLFFVFFFSFKPKHTNSLTKDTFSLTRRRNARACFKAVGRLASGQVSSLAQAASLRLHLIFFFLCTIFIQNSSNPFFSLASFLLLGLFLGPRRLHCRAHQSCALDARLDNERVMIITIIVRSPSPFGGA